MSGDEAFEEVFRREYPSVLRTVALIVIDREVAAEVTQEAFTQLHLKWRRISRYDRPGAWVRRVAIRDAVRHRQRTTRGVVVETQASSREALDDALVDVDVVRAIAALPTQQRAAVVLRYYADLSMSDIAAALGCAEATARVHLHRGRGRLAELLGADDEEDVDDIAR